MRDYWFRVNSWGWGFVPISFKGYLLLLGLILVIVFTGFVTGMYDRVTFWSLVFYFSFLVAEVIGFGYIANKKVRRKVKRKGRKK